MIGCELYSLVSFYSSLLPRLIRSVRQEHSHAQRVRYHPSWHCLDNAFRLKHRVQLQKREDK